ncbi:MAG: leucine-rich repeat domain-containing protein [Lachnospiraceae bacterium]|nr:leucine-rich repeat domain-containing protein [Lachnospiraceae bacterium]
MQFKEQKLQLQDIILQYSVQNNNVTITGMEGFHAALAVPEAIENLPVTVIGKKAFLGKSCLERVTLPKTVMRLEDYAFAQCGRLKEVEAPGEVSLGTGVFKGCKSMERLALGEISPDAQILMAALCCHLKADYLLSDPERGSERWFERWDQCLLSFLMEDDEENYHDLVFCGEEDIGIRMQDQILEEKKLKAYLCFLRLAHPTFLKEDGRRTLTDYLLHHTKGCASEEAWQVLTEQLKEQMQYFKLFADLGGVTKDNLDGMISDLDETQTEAKAFLIRFREEHFGEYDIFADFTL